MDELYIVFDAYQFNDAQQKENGRPAEAVMGYVKARDEISAKDTATSIFPQKKLFVRPRGEAEQIYIDAAEKQGILNSSDAHTHL